jgi:hypothetical protein
MDLRQWQGRHVLKSKQRCGQAAGTTFEGSSEMALRDTSLAYSMMARVGQMGLRERPSALGRTLT